MQFSSPQHVPNSNVPQIPLGELTALPRSPRWWGGWLLPTPQETFPCSRPFRPCT